METSLTAAQLYADLVAAETPKMPPEGAFSLAQFAAATGLDRQNAQRKLQARLKAGELCGDKFPTSGHPRWWYWFTDAIYE